MKKLIIVFGLMLTAANVSAQQPVAVTATVMGANGAVYSNGTYQIQLVDATGAPVQSFGVSGGTQTQTQFSGALSSAGSLAVSLYASTVIGPPTGPQWSFRICSAKPTLNLPLVVTVQVCFAQSLTIAAAGDVSTALSASAPALYTLNPVEGTSSFPSSGGSPTGSGYALPAFPSASGVLAPSNIVTDATGNSLNVPGAVAAGAAVTASNPVNVKHPTYGCKGDGTTDDTACLQASINAAATNQDDVDLPYGVYMISDTLTITNPIKMRCIGARGYWHSTGSCVIQKSSSFSSSTANSPGLAIVGNKSAGTGGAVVIEGITVDGQSGGSTGDGIEILANKTTLRDVSVTRQAGDGIRIGDAADAYDANEWMLDGVTTLYNGGNGLTVSSGTGGGLDDANAGTGINLTSNFNLGDGVRLGKSFGNIFVGGSVEGNTGIGFDFTGGSYCQVLSVDNETNTAGSLAFNTGIFNKYDGNLTTTWTDATASKWGSTNEVIDYSHRHRDYGAATATAGSTVCYGCGPSGQTGYEFEIPDSDTTGAIAATNFITNQGTKIGIRHANGTGVAAGPSALVLGSFIRGFYYDGYDGTAWTNGAYTDCVLDAAPSSGVMPCAFRVFTNSGGTLAERFRINSYGGIAIGGVSNGNNVGIYLGGSQLVGTSLLGIESSPTYPTTATNIYSFFSYPVVPTGTTTNVTHYYAADGGITASTVATQYGYYDGGLTKGTSANWGIYTATKSYFGAGFTTPSQMISTIATGTPPFVVASTTPVSNLSIGGNAATATSAPSGFQVGTDTSGTVALTIDAATGNSRVIKAATAGLARTFMQLANGTAESGSNVGSDFEVMRYADDGSTFLGDYYLCTRSTGGCYFPNTISGSVSGNAGTASALTSYGKVLANCGTMPTTAATTDTLSCTWVTTASNCTATQNSTTTIVPWTAVVPTAGVVTVTHTIMAGGTYAIACSAN